MLAYFFIHSTGINWRTSSGNFIRTVSDWCSMLAGLYIHHLLWRSEQCTQFPLCLPLSGTNCFCAEPLQSIECFIGSCCCQNICHFMLNVISLARGWRGVWNHKAPHLTCCLGMANQVIQLRTSAGVIKMLHCCIIYYDARLPPLARWCAVGASFIFSKLQLNRLVESRRFMQFINHFIWKNFLLRRRNPVHQGLR